LRRGMLRLRRKEYSEAVSDLSRAYTASQDAETGLLLAEALLGAGRAEEARKLLEVLSTSNDPTVRKHLPELLLATGQQEAALAELERTLVADSQNTELMARFAELLTPSDPIRAIDYWKQVLSKVERAEYITGYASALLKAARFEEAVREYQRSLRLQDSYEAHAGLGLALFKLEQFAPAAEQFIVVMRKRPEVAINYYFLGICFDRMGDLVQAEKAYVYFKQVADPDLNRLEIEKVDLRLPILRRQLEKGKKKR
ncbi:MAG: tetratricopeptide repeat protein, partial [Candidatus Bathyarchaeia archaeon]